MNTLLVLLLLAAPTEPSSALLRWLSAIDQVPTVEQLAEAGVGPDGAALFAVASDRRLTRYPRARAAGLLGRYDRPEAREALIMLASSDDLEVRVQAIGALAFLEGKNGVPHLAKWLADPEPELRAAAIRALVRLDDVTARSVLLDHRARESVPYVKALLPSP